MDFDEEQETCLTVQDKPYLTEKIKHGGLQDDGDDDTSPDDVIRSLGGCGRFQFLIGATIQIMKLAVCWVMMGNSFIAFVPAWDCIIDDASPNLTVGVSSTEMVLNASGMTEAEKCAVGCTRYEFYGPLNTIVNEFDLVCDLSWVTATITSVQMVGMCVGSLISGQLSDAFGRKAPIFSAMAILGVSNLVAYFSINWVMFAVCKFFIGVASAFFLSVYCTIQGEWALSRWRSVLIGFPSWALEAGLFALVAFLVPDWKKLTMIVAILSFLFLVPWIWTPESFRWYITKGKYKQAEQAVARVARWNKKSVPRDFQKMCDSLAVQSRTESSNGFTLIALFRTVAMLKLTLPLMVTWLTMGFIAYGINFGIKKLSGNIFLNLFLFSIASVPSKLMFIYLQNRFGRRKAGMIAFLLCLIGGSVVGIAQYLDFASKDTLTNVFALIAMVGVDGAWGPIQTLTVEIYPTVVRNTGFGFQSILARFGAVIGPQFVYLGDYVPGILYFTVALLSVSSIACMFLLPETMDTELLDRLTHDIEAHRTKEHKYSKAASGDLPTTSSEDI